MNRKPGRVAGLLIVAVLALGVVAPVSAATPRKVALGVSMLPYDSIALVDQFRDATGRNPAIWSVWSAWGGGNKHLPGNLMAHLKTHQIVPMVIWEPVWSPDPDGPDRITYDKILRGDYDAYITAFAQAARDYDSRILLRFAHEMNGTWFPWSTQRFTNTPTKFRQAWKYIWNIFKGPNGVGATNVKFLWSPIKPCAVCDTVASVYPGSTYVDYAGITAFNWGGNRPWVSMVTAIEPSMKKIAAVTSKPVIVAEVGSFHKADGVVKNKPAWIKNGYPAVYTKWPKIKAIVYFNVWDDDAMLPNRDWRLTTPDTGPLLAYKKILQDVRFQGRIS